jgi:biopolymer transport protein ExbB
MSTLMTIVESVKTSGIPGFIIVGMGAVAVFIIIERYKKLNLSTKEDSGDFIESIKGYILNDQIGKAVTYCDANKSIPASKVVKAILERSNRDEASMLNAASLAMGQVEGDLAKRMDYLPALANVSTLVGLFGTIVGLIFSFASLGDAESVNKSEALSAGISMAMSTTAMGLAVAIPALVAFAYLNNRMNKLLDQCNEYGSETLDLVKSRFFKS